MLFEVLIRETEVIHKVKCFLDCVLAPLDVLQDVLEYKLHVVILNLHTGGLSMEAHHLLQLSNESLRLLLTHVLA